jgi:integrase
MLGVVLERHYFPLNLRVRCEQTRKQYRYAVGNLSEHLGRPATVADLSDDNVTRMMGWLRDVQGLHPRTVNDRRWRINALWTWLARRGFVRLWPTNCALPVPLRTPRAWTQEEIDRLVAAASRSEGMIGDIPARQWWLDLFFVEWDLGGRKAEVLAFEWQWLDLSTGFIHVPAEVRKAKRADACYRLMPDTMARLRLRAKKRGKIFPFPLHETRFYQLFDKLLEAAGLPRTRYTKMQCWRRSFATHLKCGGGDPTVALGHGSAAVTIEHYIDPTLTAERHGERMPFRLLREQPEKSD